jgi:putative hydrolase of the HAD superfamily
MPRNISCYNFRMAGKIRRYHEARTRKPVKFIYFDIGGVLLDFSGSFVNLAKVLNAPLEDVRKFWNTYEDALGRGTLSPNECWQRFKMHFRYRGQDIDFSDLWVTGLRPIKESHAFVKKISRTHKIGLLSNAMTGTVAKTRALCHIPRATFSAIIESSKIGFIKPEPEIYSIARERAGVHPGEILFIDDSEINLPPAHESGFHTYHFDTNNPEASIAELERLLHL